MLPRALRLPQHMAFPGTALPCCSSRFSANLSLHQEFPVITGLLRGFWGALVSYVGIVRRVYLERRTSRSPPLSQGLTQAGAKCFSPGPLTSLSTISPTNAESSPAASAATRCSSSYIQPRTAGLSGSSGSRPALHRGIQTAIPHPMKRTIYVALSIAFVAARSPVHRQLRVERAPANWSDTAPYTRRFLSRLKCVRLEYLDWGGTEQAPMTAAWKRVDNPCTKFDDLAPAFTDRFHVIAYARRGHA